MRQHTSKKAKAGWLILSGAMLGWAMYLVIGGVGITGRGGGIGIKLPRFILIGIGLILVSYGIYWIGRRVERWRQSHHQPSRNIVKM